MTAPRLPKGAIKPAPRRPRTWRPTRRPPAAAPTNCASISTRTPSAARRDVIEFLQDQPRCRPTSPSTRSTASAKASHRRATSASRPTQFVFTNGTDEAIQVFINTYVDDGQEVLVLKPAYAMYRFYAEVAGAKIVEVAYPQPVDGVSAAGGARRHHAADPRRPPLQSQQSHRHRPRPARPSSASWRARKKAVVMVDEAYYEFSGVTALTEIERVPNLFVSRTFSKVFGMAAHALGCLFSHPANIAVPAQGAVALQREFAGGAGRAGRRAPTRPTSKTTSPKCWPRANCSASAWRSWASRYVPSSANFVLGHFGKRAIEVRDAPARPGHPGARPQLRSARLRPHHRRHARADPPPAGSAGRDLEPMNQP